MTTDALGVDVLPPNDPVRRLKESIEAASKELAACHGNIKEIQDRTFFQQLFANSSKDMTALASGHLSAMNVMFRLIQNGIELDVYNAEGLLRLRQELEDSESKVQGPVREYISMARGYVETACRSQVAFGKRVEILEDSLHKESHSLAENLGNINQWIQYFEFHRIAANDKVDSLIRQISSFDEKLEQYNSANAQGRVDIHAAFLKTVEDQLSELRLNINLMVSEQLRQNSVDIQNQVSRSRYLWVICGSMACASFLISIAAIAVVLLKH